jgi:hypothetical protein
MKGHIQREMDPPSSSTDDEGGYSWCHEKSWIPTDGELDGVYPMNAMLEKGYRVS